MSRFVQVLLIARANRLLKLGNIAPDGTKVRANASRHSALSYGHALQSLRALPPEPGTVHALAADNGFMSEANVRAGAAPEAQDAPINTPFQPVGSPLIKSEYPCVHTNRS